MDGSLKLRDDEVIRNRPLPDGSGRSNHPQDATRAARLSPWPATRTKVIYIAGRGRSGSTLLDSVLGQTPGFFSAGEIALGGRRLEQEGLCGCRTPVRACPVWSEALMRAFGDPAAAQAAMKNLFAIGRTKTDWLGAMAGGKAGRRLRRRHDRALARLPALYAALAQTTGARVIVDSSKSPVYGFALSLLPQIDLHVLHLVRDPRAVSYSWLRQASRRLSSDDPLHRRSFSSAASSWRWTFVNSAAEALLRKLDDRYRLLRYEDFVHRPAETFESILDWVGESSVAPASLAAGRVNLAAGHTISGNPSRFKTGEVELKLDDEWRDEMPPTQRRIASILTWPLRSRYGYAP